MADETYQSLYRRYRPGHFADVLGQDHVTHALRNAVRDGRVGQGYLFSGPRGTGKTSTARILAKALNCEDLADGEPCGVCESCVSVGRGSSFAVIEMDAASNNGVDAMRDLVSKASLGTTGLRKVYIIDEVHMLTPGASNTLLKTLEEPPSHVVFVLATTDPQKVLPTIISRVQHFNFHLLGADTLGGLVRAVNADAGLGLDDSSLDKVVRRGAGSARDALSGLDQAAALGQAEDEVPVAAEVLDALVDRDPGRALAAVAAGCAAGRDPRRLADETLSALRDAFLAGRAPALVDLPPAEVERVAEVGRKLGAAALVRAMEVVGEATTQMKEALDPRVSLEVALVRITAPEADASPGALLERIERLERRLEGASAMGGPNASSPEPSRPVVAAPPMDRPVSPRSGPSPEPAPDMASTVTGNGGDARREALAKARAISGTAAPTRPARGASSGGSPPPPPPPGASPSGSGGRRTVGSVRNAGPGETAPDAGPAPASEPATVGQAPSGQPSSAAASGDFPTSEALTKAWENEILGGLHPRARSRFSAGRFVASDGNEAVYALPGVAHRDQCLPFQGEVESALAAHFGRSVPLRLVGEEVQHETDADGDDESVLAEELRDAPRMAPTSPAERVKSAFPGAKEVDR